MKWIMGNWSPLWVPLIHLWNLAVASYRKPVQQFPSAAQCFDSTVQFLSRTFLTHTFYNVHCVCHADNSQGGLVLEFNEFNPVLNKAKVWRLECGPLKNEGKLSKVLK